MAATALTERYAPNLHGVLSCSDRVIVTSAGHENATDAHFSSSIM